MISLMRQAMADTLRMLWAMPSVVLVAFILALGMDTLQIALQWTGSFGMIAINLVGWLLLSLYFIMVHRFVILGEVATHFPLAIGGRGWRFFVNGLLLGLVGVIPVLILIPLAIAFKYSAILSVLSWLLVAVAAVAFLLLLLLAMRLVVVLPAIAVDAPGAGWANAFSDTKGYTLRIFMTYIVAGALFGLATMIVLVALFFVGKLVGVLTAGAAVVVTIGKVGMHVFVAATKVLGWTLFVAIASNLFVGLADRSKAPASI